MEDNKKTIISPGDFVRLIDSDRIAKITECNYVDGKFQYKVEDINPYCSNVYSIDEIEPFETPIQYPEHVSIFEIIGEGKIYTPPFKVETSSSKLLYPIIKDANDTMICCGFYNRVIADYFAEMLNTTFANKPAMRTISKELLDKLTILGFTGSVYSRLDDVAYWLRDNHGIYIEIVNRTDDKVEWWWGLKSVTDTDKYYDFARTLESTYEDALETAVTDAVEIITNGYNN